MKKDKKEEKGYTPKSKVKILRIQLKGEQMKVKLAKGTEKNVFLRGYE